MTVTLVLLAAALADAAPIERTPVVQEAPQDPAAIEVESVDPNAYGAQASQLLWSFSGSYTFDNLDDSEVESFRLEMSLGWFLAKAHEIGARLAYAYDKTSFDEGGGTTNDGVRFGPYYNWNTELSPRLDGYLGPHAEILSFDPEGGGRESQLGAGLQVGARYWVRPGIALQLEPRWTRREGGEDEFQTLFGVSFVL